MSTPKVGGETMMHLHAFFVAHTGIHIPTLHECRETLNPHIGTGTSNLNMQVVLYRVFLAHLSTKCSW